MRLFCNCIMIVLLIITGQADKYNGIVFTNSTYLEGRGYTMHINFI